MDDGKVDCRGRFEMATFGDGEGQARGSVGLVKRMVDEMRGGINKKEKK